MRLPLDVGLGRSLHIREEHLAQGRASCRLLYVSDVHLRPGRSTHLTAQVLEAATDSRPDLVLLGGDLVDRANALPALTRLITALTTLAPVMAIAGNHDAAVGLPAVQHAVVAGGGLWIHDTSAVFTHNGRSIVVSGPDAGPADQGDVRVLCAHNPRIWRRVRALGYDLVLAGHLHGFQVVACEYRDRLYPGAWFYPYCFLSHQHASTRLVVSRGVSDLLPIRWMCPREVVLCHV